MYVQYIQMYRGGGNEQPLASTQFLIPKEGAERKIIEDHRVRKTAHTDNRIRYLVGRVERIRGIRGSGVMAREQEKKKVRLSHLMMVVCMYVLYIHTYATYDSSLYPTSTPSHCNQQPWPVGSYVGIP